MREITRESDGNRYFIYKDCFITKQFPSGYYECFLGDGFVQADTQAGIKQMINDKIKTGKGIY